MKKSTSHTYRKYLTLGIFSLASLIMGTLYVMAAGGPLGYTYCVDEGGNCTLNGSTDVTYGANGYFLYQTVDIGTTSVRCTNSTFGGDPIFGTVKSCYKKVSIASVIANLPWLNSQGVAITESQANGFAIAAGTSKEVNVWSECKKITAGTKNVFVPSLTQNEWNKFKAGAGNVGATLAPCGTSVLPVNGACKRNGAGVITRGYDLNGNPNGCSSGTEINFETRCDLDWTTGIGCNINPATYWDVWDCRGLNGGTTVNCQTPDRIIMPGTCSNGATDYPTCTPPAVVTNGACNNPNPPSCTAGTSADDNGNTTAGSTRTWRCLGSGVGATNASCSYTNPAGPSCNNNGVRDNGEAGVDCGGGNCGACGPSPVNCTFTQDAGFGACSASCGPGSQYKYYHITTPASNGGTCAVSEGEIVATNSCNLGACPTSCSPPTSWGACNGSCGGGAGERSGVNSCSNTVSESCTNNSQCPRDGGWSTWSSWSACSATACGTSGTKTRTRSCTNPTPAYGGADCLGSPTEDVLCNATACATTGPYTYGGWGACSASCGGGTQSRSESCSYDICTEQQATSQSCNTQACPTCNNLTSKTCAGWFYTYRTYSPEAGGCINTPNMSPNPVQVGICSCSMNMLIACEAF